MSPRALSTPGAALGDQPKVRAETLSSCLNELKAWGMSAQAVAESSGCPPETLNSARGRLSWNAYCSIMELTAQAVGGAPSMRSVGHTVETDDHTRRVSGGFRAIVSPRTVYQVCFRWLWPSFWPDLEFDLYSRGANTLEMVVQVPNELRPCPEWFYMAQGVLEKAPVVMGMSASTVALDLDESGRRGRFMVQHAASGTIWNQAQGTLRAVFAPSQLIESLRAQTIELNKQLTELNRARERAEEALALKDRFLTNISHELRTPLTAALGLAGMLEESDLDDRQQEMVGGITRANRALLRSLEIVLDYSQSMNGGELALSQEVFEPAHLFREVIHQLPMPTDRLMVDIAALEHCEARGDRLRLARVIHELIRNALTFAPSGDVKVRAAPDADGNLRFDVHDGGPGIPQEIVGRLFEAFTQADSTLTRAHEGLGMGLAISRKLVEAMGGSLEVANTSARGTHCMVRVPIQCHPQEKMPVVPSGGRVLVVDDNPVNRRILKRMVSKLGFEVEEAENGLEAVDQVKAHTPHAILMDCQMPVMDGLEATREIRRLPGGAAILIVAVTAHTQPGYANRCLAAGMNGYLSKPISKARLETTLT